MFMIILKQDSQQTQDKVVEILKFTRGLCYTKIETPLHQPMRPKKSERYLRLAYMSLHHPGSAKQISRQNAMVFVFRLYRGVHVHMQQMI